MNVVTAVADGNLKQTLTVEAKGEIAALADTINSMIETLATFADQVTSVAREVGVEGKLGGQAKVPGAAGTWKALTENVNQLAANLTTQVRAIAEVATAVTKGDLTRSITVEALGAFGGWGWRRVPGALGVVLRNGEALRVERKQGHALVVTVEDAATAAALVNALAARQGA